MTMASQLARFVDRRDFDDISTLARDELKTRVLDALRCAVGALEHAPGPARASADRGVRRPLVLHADRRRTHNLFIDHS
jgi:2-methylcitrate dehydratase PrpD